MSRTAPPPSELALGGLVAWLEDRLVEGDTLVCPVRVVWNDYVAYCAELGFATWPADSFVRRLSILEGVRVVDRGRGRRRRCFEGIGLRPATERKTTCTS